MSFSVFDITVDESVETTLFELNQYVKEKSYSHPRSILKLINNSWKQVVYVGYYMEYDTFNNFIDICINNGITHIILEFILFGSNYSSPSGNWSTLETVDVVDIWTKFTPSQQIDLSNKIVQNGIVLMASFGGATSFGNFAGSKYYGFQYTWQNPDSKYYIGKYNNSIQESATALGNDLASLLLSNNIKGIDFDIESIPVSQSGQIIPSNLGDLKRYSKNLKSSYNGNYDDIYNYLGYMSKAVKDKGITTVSHAPQPPYFYPFLSGSWKQLYYNVDKYFGQYIDFYNIQYYNNGDYNSQSLLFTDDTYFDASVNQLITANNGEPVGLNTIESNKIVLGEAIDANWPGDNKQNWLDLTGFVQNQRNSSNSNLAKWYNVGGIMTWLYRLDSTKDTNSYLLSYFNTLKH